MQLVTNALILHLVSNYIAYQKDNTTSTYLDSKYSIHIAHTQLKILCIKYLGYLQVKAEQEIILIRAIFFVEVSSVIATYF